MQAEESRNVAIVGAGVAGVAAARALIERGVEVVVVDKGRRPGGRLAARTRGGLSFDHGAQFFTARDPDFSDVVDGLARRGVVAPWEGHLVTIDGDAVSARHDTVVRWVGVPEMNSVAAALAEGVPVRCGVRVDGIRRHEGRWRLGLDDGASILADAVIVTAPPEQSAHLLGAVSPRLGAAVSRVPMAPCWAVMVSFGQRLELPFDGAFVASGPLSWVARNSSKPGRPAAECWMLHGSPVYSAEHLEDPPGVVAESLLAAFRDLAPQASAVPSPASLSAHRWRYALPRDPADERCLADAEGRLVAAGDWCGGPRVEGAWLSGRAAAEQVVAWL